MKIIKKVILCADDYGQKNSVSQAIVQLIEAKRLSAVSCMVTQADWIKQGVKLLPYQQAVDVGLHFNLTEGRPLSSLMKNRHGFLSLKQLLYQATRGRLDHKALVAELHAQLDVFVAVLGGLPTFIDGHQHIQHFPLIREAILEVYAKRLIGTGCYLRCISTPFHWKDIFSPAWFKRWVLEYSGAAVFKKWVHARGIPHNSSFSGIYPFSDAKKYSQYFPQFLSRITTGGLILCHPGWGESDDHDAIAEVRGYEFRYLKSHQFLRDCLNAGVELARFRSL